MSQPFVKDRRVTREFRQVQVGPAWFSRPVDTWETECRRPLLLGGESGGTLKRAILSILEGAKDILAVCSFILGDRQIVDTMLEAASRGVRVYILTASKDRLVKDPTEDEARQKKIQEEHEATLNHLCKNTLLRDAQVHAKFVLADPRTEDKRGVLSTANLTTDAFLHPEIGVELREEMVDDLFRLFVTAWWGLAERELLQQGILTSIRDIIPPVSDQLSGTLSRVKHLLMTYPHVATSLREAVKGLITESTGDVLISTYGIAADNSLYDDILSGLNHGRPFRLLVRPRPRKTPILHVLSEKGALVRGLDLLHAKIVTAETPSGPKAIIMTANLEKISMEDGFEVGVQVTGNDALEVRRIMDIWWKNAGWEYSTTRKYGDHLGEYQVHDNGEAIRRQIVSEKEISLGRVEVPDLALYRDFIPELPTVPDAHSVVFTWTTMPPMLPRDCKRYRIDGMDESMRLWTDKRGRTFISVSSEAELEDILERERPKATIVYEMQHLDRRANVQPPTKP